MVFSHKYRPRNFSEVIGQENAPRVLQAVAGWKKGSKPIFIYGPPGCGKTAAAYAISKELSIEYFEINASDSRNKAEIEQGIGAAIKQQSLFSSKKLILIDEVDGLSGQDDRGGISAIADLLTGSVFPIILTASNPFDSKFSSLRKKCSMVEFSPLSPSSIFTILKRVCESEKIPCEEAALKAISRRSSGDARSAINDLQSIAIFSSGVDSALLNTISDRDRDDSIKNALLRIFKTTDFSVAARAFDNVREDIDEQMLWLDENLPKEYTSPKELEMAYNSLSKADVFRGRIRRMQYWRLLAYINILITAGVAVSKDAKYTNEIEYAPTSRLLKIWMANQKNLKKKAISEKIAQQTHCSRKTAFGETLAYIQLAFKNNPGLGTKLAEELDLSVEEIEWISK